MNNFLKQYYGVTSKDAATAVLEDAVNVADDFFRMVGDEKYIDIKSAIQEEIAIRVEEDDTELLLQLERA